MKQIIQLGYLFDMSVASLSKFISTMSQNGQAQTDKYTKVKKQLEGVERSIEKLQNLKNRIKKLDPNQESLSHIRSRVSNSNISKARSPPRKMFMNASRANLQISTDEST